GDGRAVEDSPAWVVREIFRRIAAGDSYSSIIRDLNARRVPTAGTLLMERNGGHRPGRPNKDPSMPLRWTLSGIKVIASNPAYIGKRIYQGEVLDDVEAKWPPLVDEDVFWAVQKRLDSPGAKRWGRAKYLLSYLAKCAVCGGWLNYTTNKPTPGYGYQPVGTYICAANFCTAITQKALDDHVERVMIAWLSDPEVFADLTKVDDSAIAAQARAEANQLRVDLEDWRRQAEAGDVTAATFARVEKDRLTRIGEAEQRAQSATVPSVLVGNIGPAAAARWAKLDLPVKRQIITAVADIRLAPVGQGFRVPVADRVVWRTRLGPVAEPSADELQWTALTTVAAVAAALDELGVPEDAGRAQATTALRRAGYWATNANTRAALISRDMRAKDGSS
ncbi:MAG TPA: recombinase family protein, partial [Kribbellaceae bacterium]